MSATRAPATWLSATSSARRSAGDGDGDQRELALDRLVGAQLGDAQHVDELVHLLLDLLERVLAAVDAQCQPRDVGPLGRPDREALDVVAAAREELRDARERAGLVLEPHGDRVRRHAATTSPPGASITSTAAAPAGIIGKHFSSASQRTSTTALRPAENAAVSAASSSSSDLDGEAGAAVRLGQLRVVRHGLRQVRLREALVVEHLLPLSHHAEPAVVDDHDDDRQALERGGRELLARHLEAAVAVDADDRRVGTCGLGADRGRQRRSPSCRARPR